MIEKFDLTRSIGVGGNFGPSSLEEAYRLKKLIMSEPNNLDYQLEQARFFASHDDDILTVIAYCKIIKLFNNNIIAYEELAKYLYFSCYYDWAITTAVEGLKYDYENKKLKEILTLSCKELTD